MEQLTKLLEQLAMKLGTTAEDMFRVLTEQAKIEATRLALQNIMNVFVLIVGGVMVYYSVIHFENEWLWVGIVSGFIMFVVFGYTFLDTIADIITCKKNPQYWALNKIFYSLNVGE
jgi:hypothetical protein